MIRRGETNKGLAGKKKTLEDLFRPPLDIMHKGTLNTVSFNWTIPQIKQNLAVWPEFEMGGGGRATRFDSEIPNYLLHPALLGSFWLLFGVFPLFSGSWTWPSPVQVGDSQRSKCARIQLSTTQPWCMEWLYSKEYH